MTQYQNEEIPTHGKMMMKGGLPPNGKNTQSGFHKSYKGNMIVDPNRPGSAQVAQTRPFVSNYHIFIQTYFIFFNRLVEPVKAEKDSFEFEGKESGG